MKPLAKKTINAKTHCFILLLLALLLVAVPASAQQLFDFLGQTVVPAVPAHRLVVLKRAVDHTKCALVYKNSPAQSGSTTTGTCPVGTTAVAPPGDSAGDRHLAQRQVPAGPQKTATIAADEERT